MPVSTVSKSDPTVPDRLNHAVAKLEEARIACLEAAKAIDHDLIPTLPYHRDVLLAMDTVRDAETDLSMFCQRLLDGSQA